MELPLVRQLGRGLFGTGRAHQPSFPTAEVDEIDDMGS
jgi:hypothetical protein